MADSGALRQRRSKAHKAGDHSLCGSRCNAAARGAAVLSIVPPPAELDPAAEMRALAARLTTAQQADPGNALLARELRMTLQALLDASRQADGELAALFAEYGAS